LTDNKKGFYYEYSDNAIKSPVLTECPVTDRLIKPMHFPDAKAVVRQASNNQADWDD